MKWVIPINGRCFNVSLHVAQNALQLCQQIVQRIVIAASWVANLKMLELEIEEKMKKKLY
jgi:hypothetical protein